MALTLVGSLIAGTQRGITSEELLINCSSFVIEIEPEINDWLPGIDGQAIGKAVGDPMSKLTIEGEIKATLTQTFVTAFVPVNPTSYFGRSAGAFYFDRATITLERDGWKTVSMEASSRFKVV